MPKIDNKMPKHLQINDRFRSIRSKPGSHIIQPQQQQQHKRATKLVATKKKMKKIT